MQFSPLTTLDMSKVYRIYNSCITFVFCFPKPVSYARSALLWTFSVKEHDYNINLHFSPGDPFELKNHSTATPSSCLCTGVLDSYSSILAYCSGSLTVKAHIITEQQTANQRLYFEFKIQLNSKYSLYA